MQTYDVAIIGAGGAGMMCAVSAGRRGRSVVLLDHSDRIGRKILISGGGRCNFTNLNARQENYTSNNPHFCKSALARFRPEDFVDLVRKHRIAFHEKKLGQLFCDNSAQDIVDMLVAECQSVGAQFKLGCRVCDIRKNARFAIETNIGPFSCQSLVIATGGLSVPQTGATGFGYEIARQFGLKIVDTSPALDGFVFTDKQIEWLSELAGVSIECIVSCNNVSFRENILITHRGLSGPAMLQASLYWRPGQPLTINLLPNTDVHVWLKGKRHAAVKAQLKTVLAEKLPRRFSETFCRLFFPTVPVNQLTGKQLLCISNMLTAWKIVPASTVGYRKAEVTKGGVDTNELSSKSMEAKKVPGLFFVGEVVDVAGWLGGYNFQWAWSSGYAAGQYV